MDEIAVDERARELAARAHTGQARKGNGAPYFTHLESVSSWLETHGYSDALTHASAYLHDLIEDQPAFEAELRATMPREVVRTVELLSETKLDANGEKLPKAVRMARYIETLRAALEAGDAFERNAASRAAVVSCCDKLDNAASLLESERKGEKLFERMKTRPGDHRKNHAALRALYAGRVHRSLLEVYDRVTDQLSEYADAWLVSHAVSIAAGAHRGQRDKAGAAYVMHPLRLMMRARTSHERMAAVLHDVIEDTAWTMEALRAEGFPDEVLEALECLTKRRGEDYAAFVARAAENPIAARVKLFDLEDNMDLKRLDAMTEKDHARIEKYVRARSFLLARGVRADG